MKIANKIVAFGVLLICIMTTMMPCYGMCVGDSSLVEIKVWDEPEMPINPYVVNYPIGYATFLQNPSRI